MKPQPLALPEKAIMVISLAEKTWILPGVVHSPALSSIHPTIIQDAVQPRLIRVVIKTSRLKYYVDKFPLIYVRLTSGAVAVPWAEIAVAAAVAFAVCAFPLGACRAPGRWKWSECG